MAGNGKLCPEFFTFSENRKGRAREGGDYLIFPFVVVVLFFVVLFFMFAFKVLKTIYF